MSKQFYFKQFIFHEYAVLMQKSSKLKPWFSSIQPIDRTLIRCYHSRPEWTWEQWQWRGTPHSQKLQHYWNLTIRLFSVISRTLVLLGEGSYPSAEKQSVYSTAPADLAIQLDYSSDLSIVIAYTWKILENQRYGYHENHL